jgi:hypothetical protein
MGDIRREPRIVSVLTDLGTAQQRRAARRDWVYYRVTRWCESTTSLQSQTPIAKEVPPWALSITVQPAPR